MCVQNATETCKSLGISGKELNDCIYDVAVTNDTAFADEEELKNGKFMINLKPNLQTIKQKGEEDQANIKYQVLKS